ncbi:hypothetical protein ACJ73_06956 [Blastomyces percursus]|uniref:Uncharacterized protein n=1 Tax=Blastomyces percursus TaxID=1658174 RepID=A0A1J9PZF8_9EURO|nr:hypothetical protein ACJ73_06956 [Blastomyces percursus]
MGRKVPMWDSSYPKFNIDALKAPGEPIKLYNKTLDDYTSNEDSHSEELEKLFKHYGWGFEYSLVQHEDEAVFRHLVKIVHYMRDDLKPSQEDFEKCNSDAGPGLLRAECFALPFSLDHPPPAKNEPMEYFRKAIFHFPYQSLERCPSAFPILPNATENHRIKSTDPGAMDNRPHGQGATKDEHIGNILDCMIAAAYLLDAGCTKADRTTLNWHSTLQDQAKWFLELIWIDWGRDSDYDTFKRTPKLSPKARFERVATLKRNITEMLGQDVTNKRKYKGRLIAAIWECCTSSFLQFLVRYSHKPLHEGGIEIPSSTGYIPLRGTGTDATENTIQAQMAYFFDKIYVTECYCNLPGSKKVPVSTHQIQLRFHELPLRLTFVTDPTSPPTSHTAAEVTIQYYDWKCRRRGAKYRWLGGIYPITSGKSFQYVLFWSDHQRHEKRDKTILRQYSPQECDRQITRGVFKHSERSELVPLSKWQSGQPALLFYEKVLVPEEINLKGILVAAKHVIPSCHDPVIKHREIQHPPGSSSQTVGAPAPSPQQGIKHSTGYPKASISSQPTNPRMTSPPKQQGPTKQGPPEGSRAQPARKTGTRQYGGEALQYPGDSGQLRQGIQAGPEPRSRVSTQYLSGYHWLPQPQQNPIDRPSMSSAQKPPPPEYLGDATDIGRELGRTKENVEFANPLKPFSPEYMPDSSRVYTSQALEHGEVLDSLFAGMPSEPLDPHGLGLSVDEPPTSPLFTNYTQPMPGMSPQPSHAQPSPEHADGQQSFSSPPSSTIPPLPDVGTTPYTFPLENYFAGGGLPSSQQVQGAEAFVPLQELFGMYPGEAPLPQGPGTHIEPAKRKEPPEYEAEESGSRGKRQRKGKGRGQKRK